MKQMNNKDFIKNLMSFSPNGLMIQVFVIQALQHYTRVVTENGVPKEKGNEIISPIFWYNIGMEVKERLENNYNLATSAK